MTAAMKVSNSWTSPTFRAAVFSFRPCFTWGQMLAGMKAREQAEHF